MQRILIVSGSYPDIPCGIAPYVAKVAGMLAERGRFEVDVLTSNRPEVRRETEAAGGQTTPEGVAGYDVYPVIDHWSLFSMNDMITGIEKLAPDVVFIQNPTLMYRGFNSILMSLLVPRLKRRLPDLRLVVMQHDIAVAAPWSRVRYRPLLRAADAIALSNSRDIQAVRDQGIEPAKIYRVPLMGYPKLHSFDPGKKKPYRCGFGIPADAVCICYFGFVLPGRNLDILLQAIQGLRQKGYPVHGLIMGGAHKEASRYYEDCRKLARQLGINEHTTWTGFAGEQQIADGLAAADLFVSLPDRGADMRNTSILTALRSGLPVITSRNEHFYIDRELEELGCIMLPPRDVNALQAACLRLMENPVSPEQLKQQSQILHPDRIWSFHIDQLERAFRGEPAQVFSLRYTASD